MSAASPRRVARRIIPCLDVRNGRVVKGVQFRNHRIIGDIIELAGRYRDQGADELVFYDITASPEGRSVDIGWVRRVSETIDIPFCVAGGIRSVKNAGHVLEQGADKISINTPALERPGLIDELVQAFGSQCVVIGVDSIADGDTYTVRSHTGNPDAMRAPGRKTLDWLKETVARGAGEVVLNCMSSDGTRDGYDIRQLSAARKSLPIPLVASGGAGAPQHFIEVFEQADVDAALAATVFHSGQIPIPVLKQTLAAAGIEVRPC
jgi:cyclase